MRDYIVEEWLVLAIECFLEGSGLGDRHRTIFERALSRVAMNAAIQAADMQLRDIEDRKAGRPVPTRMK
mgnify:CR=1 FL=1